MREVPIDDLGEALVANLLATFEPAAPTGLGLKWVQQGSQAGMPGPDDFEDRLPGVWVEFQSYSAQPNRPRRSVEATFTWRLHYFVRIQPGDEPGRKAVADAARIARHFSQGAFDFPGGTPAGLRAQHVLVTKCWAAAVSIVADAQLVLFEFALDHSYIDVTITADCADHN